MTFYQNPGDPLFGPPGPLSASRVLAQLAAHKDVRLGSGIYVLDAPLVLTPAHSGGHIVCASGPRSCSIVRGYTAPLVGAADDPTNALIQAQGAVDTSLVNTTILAGSPAFGGVTTITLTANLPTLPVGTRMVIEGTNFGGTQESDLGDPASVISCEMVEVLSSSIVGGHTVCVLTRPTLLHHTDGCSVKGVTPVTNFCISGIGFGTAGDTVACGISTLYASHFDIENCDFVGFSRAGVNLEHGSRGWRLRNIRGRGGNNGLLHLQAAHEGSTEDLETTTEGARYHANGITRAQVSMQWISSHAHFKGTTLRHGVRGITPRGARMCTWSGTQIEDMDATIAIPVSIGGGGRDTDLDYNGWFGVGFYIDVGKQDGTQGEHAASLELGDIKCVNCRSTADYIGHAVALVDVGNVLPGFHAGSLTIEHHSGGSVAAAGSHSGLALIDVVGDIDHLSCRGMISPLSTYNSIAKVRIKTMDVVHIGGPSVQYSLRLQHNGGLNQSPQIDKLTISSLGAPSQILRLDAGFTGAPDFEFRIRDIETNLHTVRGYNCQLFANGDAGTHIAGDIVQVYDSGSNVPSIKSTSTQYTTAALAVVVLGSDDMGAGFVLATPLDGPLDAQTQVMTTGAVAIGDRLVGSATASRLESDTAAHTDPRIIKCTALTKVSAGGIVRVCH